jgi:hypothetical protein
MTVSRTFAALTGLALLIGTAHAADTSTFKPVACEGAYKRHVQGICTNQRDAIYWSWTDVLVKTDLGGKVMARREVASHHGDLCHHDGKVYVAVNLGKFNLPPGKEDSWVYVYDAATLDEVSRHRVPELVHGAGGMAYRDGRFFIIGGLPPGLNENYVYEYDEAFHFVKRHVLASGYTLMGIQTITWAQGSWWFGCYGKPAAELLRADSGFQFTGKWTFNASVGIESLADGRIMVGVNKMVKGTGNVGSIVFARPDDGKGLVLLP